METRPRISDFGLIRSVSSARNKTCTVTTKPIGTPMYMAPEALRGEVSTAMDVFGFGIVGAFFSSTVQFLLLQHDYIVMLFTEFLEIVSRCIYVYNLHAF